MSFAFGSFTLGAALLFSAFKNQSLVSLVLGQPGTSIAAQGESHPSAGSSASSGSENATGGEGESPIAVGGKTLKGHPELKPGISAVGAVILQHWPKLIITATTNGSHASGSYHYKGRAIDFASSDAHYMNEAAAWIKKHLTTHLVEGIHNPNLSVKDHVPVPSSFWGEPTWSEHTNHIHVAV